uniref:hypothetical protein n=1 Tax=Acetatifactor sp. TaxID=1872090 RepID=UPI0040577D32
MRALKWLLVGGIFAILTVVCFAFETKVGLRRHRFTAGCGIIAVVSFVTGVSQLFDKKVGTVSTLVIEDIFKMNSGGCVVVGTVKGTLAVGEKITIQDLYGNTIKTTIDGMEINRKQTKVATNTPVALLFKHIEPDRLQKGDIVSYEH